MEVKWDEKNLCKWSATGLEVRAGDLQWRTKRSMKIIYLIPSLVWPVGSQVERVSGHWRLTQKNDNGLEGRVRGSPGGRKTDSGERFGGVPRNRGCKSDSGKLQGLGWDWRICNRRQEGAWRSPILFPGWPGHLFQLFITKGKICYWLEATCFSPHCLGRNISIRWQCLELKSLPLDLWIVLLLVISVKQMQRKFNISFWIEYCLWEFEAMHT